MDTYDFDAIVVGSGISGGWAAKELTEKFDLGFGDKWNFEETFHDDHCTLRP